MSQQQLAKPDRNRIRESVTQHADLFSDHARSTVLNENLEKHVLELQLILECLPEHGRLLDLGGGVGFNLLCLRALRPHAELVLVDRLTEYTEQNRMGAASSAVTRLRERDITIDQRDFWPDYNSGHAEQYFDVTTCFDVLEHLPGHPLRQLRELARITRRDGSVIFGAPNAVSLMKRIKLLRGEHPYMDFGEWTSEPYFEHYREYTAGEYSELARRAGLRVERVLYSAAVTRSRARNRFHRGQHAALSATALALYGLFAVETLLPALRHTVYVVARKI